MVVLVADCKSCRYLSSEIVDKYKTSFSGLYQLWQGEEMLYTCTKTYAGVHRFGKRDCKYYLPKGQPLMEFDKTMKIDELPTEKDRVDLGTLPTDAILVAISEVMQPAKENKTGGLVITYKLPDGREFPQKYSKIAGKLLFEALRKLNVADTTELQTRAFKYHLTNMRVGFPRYIPVESAEMPKIPKKAK